MKGEQPAATRSLTPRQQRFVGEYLLDLNATQAATRAGYSVRTAGSQGQRLLKNVEVAAAIEAGRAELATRTMMSQEWVVEALVEEATRLGEGASHSARVAALRLLGLHLGMFKDRPPLEELLAGLPLELSDQIRQELRRMLQTPALSV